MIGLGVAVWAFYYWCTSGHIAVDSSRIPRFLAERAKATHYSAESFSLGLVSVIAEGIFVIGPTLATAFTLSVLYLPVPLQLAWCGTLYFDCLARYCQSSRKRRS